MSTPSSPSSPPAEPGAYDTALSSSLSCSCISRTSGTGLSVLTRGPEEGPWSGPWSLPLVDLLAVSSAGGSTCSCLLLDKLWHWVPALTGGPEEGPWSGPWSPPLPPAGSEARLAASGRTLSGPSFRLAYSAQLSSAPSRSAGSKGTHRRVRRSLGL